jgi:hypothetical protein
MFNLEEAIAAWRQRMRSAGLDSQEHLDELESHLRDNIDAEVAKGASIETAFGWAVSNIGDPKIVSREFRQPNRRRVPRWAIKVALALVLYSLSVVGLSRWAGIAIGSSAIFIGAGVFLLYLLAWLSHAIEHYPRQPSHRGVSLAPRSDHALHLARLESQRFCHDFVGTEHLLLGLLRIEEIAHLPALRGLDLNFEAIRREVETLVGVGQPGAAPNVLRHTPRCLSAIELAGREARGLGAEKIMPEHLLLGLLLEREGAAGLVLRKRGLDPDDLRKRIGRGAAE